MNPTARGQSAIKAYSSRLAVAALVVATLWLFRHLGIQHQLNIAALKAHRHELTAAYAHRPLLVLTLFFAAFVGLTALSIPGSVLVMTVAAGAIFGFWLGTIVNSFASAIGCSLAFLSSRYVFRDWIMRRYGGRIDRIDAGIRFQPGSYLLSLRLIPAIPFFFVNIGMALTRIRLLPFYVLSQLGMLPAMMLYANAGRELSAINSVADILSPRVLGAFLLLGISPILPKAVGRPRARRLGANGHEITTCWP